VASLRAEGVNLTILRDNVTAQVIMVREIMDMEIAISPLKVAEDHPANQIQTLKKRVKKL